VTVFGILATPNGKDVDPRLENVAPILEKLFPEYGLRRVGVKSRRLAPGESIHCPLEEGRSVNVDYLEGPSRAGKVRFKLTLEIPGQDRFVDIITTPENQTSFVDRMLPNKQRLVIGLGAR
jgi:hypothetical protein